MLRIAKYPKEIRGPQTDHNQSIIEETFVQKTKKSTKSPKYSTKMASIISRNQSKSDAKQSYMIDKNEDYYVQKYKRVYYDVILSGNGISSYTNIYERIDEINGCTGVKSPEMVRPIYETKTENTRLLIRVKNFLDYKSLTKNWPSDSFKTGVKAHSKSPQLKVNILNVEKKLKASQHKMELGNKYGLCNIRRIHNHYNQPCNKLMAWCNTISDYIHVLKNGIYIETSSLTEYYKL